jgi:glyoxylase-like metal-dependent hydrolase (beta-lactamase superfamily II)
MGGDDTWVEGIQLIHTPGHTPGSISAIVETAWGRTLLCGDIIKFRAEYFSEQYDVVGDKPMFLAAVARIRALADAIAPGHDRPFDVKTGKYLADADRESAIIGWFDKNIKNDTVCSPPSAKLS